MATPRIIDIDVLRNLLACDADAGTLTWLPRSRDMFRTQQSWKTWSTRFSGRPAFTASDNHGYSVGSIFGVRFKAHRVVWALVRGEWPNTIDHINGNRADNRISNLRNVTQMRNQRNMTMRFDNTSGQTGVYFHKDAGKWAAEVKVGGKKIYLGLFAKIEDACAARKLAEIKYGFHANHGKNSHATSI